MKKKIFGGIVILAIAAVAAFNVNFDTKSNKLSDISLANVEALATPENGSSNNTGPAKIVDCPGIGTGDAKYCLCENTNPCTDILCNK